MKACLSGDYTKGVELLSDLFIDTRNPTYIFNQGRCYEQNSRYEEAIARFREYLRKATEIAPADRSDTEKHIADCQALLAGPVAPTPASTLASPAPVPSPAPPALAAGPPPGPPPTAAAVPVEQTATAQTGHPGRGLRIAGIGCGVVGLASVGTAIYYYTRARSISDNVSHTINPSLADQQTGKDAETMQWVFYSVGAAAIVSGAVLYILGSRSITSETASVIVPTVGPSFAGLSAHGAF